MTLLASMSLALALQGAATEEYGQSTLDAAERFLEAVRGEEDFVDADFIDPMTEEEKAFLHPLERCRKQLITHVNETSEQHGGALVRNYDAVMIVLRCRGVPRTHPIGVTLRFEDARIGAIETHNFDLLED